MKNVFKTSYLSVTLMSLTLLGLSGCTKNPEGNHPPVTKLPSDKIVTTGEMISLAAMASDMDKEDELTYLWSLTARPEGSHATLTEAAKKTISFKADKEGTYYLNFIANDEIVNSKAKKITITATSIVGEWKADLSKTKANNQLNESETAEIVESLSSMYKFKFLKNGEVEGNNASSWTYSQEGNYQIDGEKKVSITNSNQFFLLTTLKSGKEVKFYYKRAI